MRTRDTPIARQLMTLMVLTTAMVLTVTWAIFISYELYNIRLASTAKLRTLAQVIATNSTAALAFQDVDDARDILGALRAEQTVTLAVLYDSRGAMFAIYPGSATTADLPDRAPPDGYRFTGNLLVAVEPVVQAGSVRLGTLYLQADMRFVSGQLLAYTGMAALGLAGALLFAYLISRVLHRKISAPILALAEASRAISERRDYSVRVPHVDMAELGVLTAAFNQMLAQIQEQHLTLRTQLDLLDLLNTISRAIAERQDLQSIFLVVLQNLEVHLGVEAGCVLLRTGTEGRWRVVASRVRSGVLPKGWQSGDIHVPTTELGASLTVVYVHDTAGSPRPFLAEAASAGLRALVAAPLLAECKVLGFLLSARREPASFSVGEIEFLRQLSEHVALAAHHTQLYNDLQGAYEEVRHSQQAVMQQERLKALGQIASGVAHDINNAMSPIALYAEVLLEREHNLTPRGRESLVTIQRAIEDVAATVARMREFYRKREPELVLGRVNLNALVMQATELTRPRWSDMPQERGIVVTLRTQLAPDLPEIMGAESEIRDALTNLIFNAVDAMRDGGTLTIATRVVMNAPSLAESGRHVHLEVSDTGVGMDEETRRRCLEPFFTTKGERGTGLGLAMVFGMVQRHSAEIEIESAPAKGSTVRLIFTPALTAADTTARLPAPRQARPLRLLIIDDDPLVIESLHSVLVNEGNAVEAANGGQQGIDMFVAALATDAPFEAVISDLGMPYVDGRKVALAVKEASRATPVILLTGWGQRLRTDNEIPDGVDHVLGKPPKLRELRGVLAEVAGALGEAAPQVH
jgi:signal transduction histidine kinase/CheY-like chemotaxis protein